MTRVVNLRREPYDVYIGRAGKGRDGYFGNPFRLGSQTSRESVMADFRLYFFGRLLDDPEFRARVGALKGKVLGCFCKPAACHGDVIVEWLERKP